MRPRLAAALGLLAAAFALSGCGTVAATLAQPDPTILPPGFVRGFNVTGYARDAFGSRAAAASLRRLAATGTTDAAFVPNWYVTDRRASDLGPSEERSPADADLRAGLRTARRLGLRVAVKPHVEVLDGTYRGDLRPDDLDAFFAAYERFAVHYATLAAQEGAGLFVVGTELTQLQRETARWRKVVAAVRRVFRGRLTYAANWNPGPQDVGFWDALDYVGVDAYQPLTGSPDDKPAVEDLVKGWQGALDRFGAVAKRARKPLLLTEVGYPARRGATAEPFREDEAQPRSLAAQRDAYEAAYRALRERPEVAGLLWWEWATDGRSDGPADPSYRPGGKPAEAVVRRWR